MSPDPAKVSCIEQYPSPTSVRQLRAFLGLANYYRQFVPEYGAIAAPLNSLLKKDVAFEWTSAHQSSLDSLKQHLCSAPILRYPEMNKPFIVQTDASYEGIGCVLLQEHEAVRHPCSYFSRGLRKHEKNYAVGALEALAMVYAADKLRQFVYDNPNVTVETDHRSLQHIQNYKGSNATVARWWIKITDAFDKAKIVYIKGSDNVVADALSRMNRVRSTDELVDEQKADPDINRLRGLVLAGTSKPEFTIDKDILLFKRRIYMPKSLRFDLIADTHKSLSHVGSARMIATLATRVY